MYNEVCNKKDSAMIVGPAFDVKPGDIKCKNKKCNSMKCYTQTAQTRSRDEGFTAFVVCTVCTKMFVMH